MSTVPAAKRCSKCKQFKDVTSFYKASRTYDGLQTYCKDCSRARARPKPTAEARHTSYVAHIDANRERRVSTAANIETHGTNTIGSIGSHTEHHDNSQQPTSALHIARHIV